MPSQVDGKLTQALADFATAQPAAHQAMVTADLETVRGPYIAIAVVALLFICLLSKLPDLSLMINHSHVQNLAILLNAY